MLGMSPDKNMPILRLLLNVLAVKSNLIWKRISESSRKISSEIEANECTAELLTEKMQLDIGSSLIGSEPTFRSAHVTCITMYHAGYLSFTLTIVVVTP